MILYVLYCSWRSTRSAYNACAAPAKNGCWLCVCVCVCLCLCACLSKCAECRSEFNGLYWIYSSLRRAYLNPSRASTRTCSAASWTSVGSGSFSESCARKKACHTSASRLFDAVCASRCVKMCPDVSCSVKMWQDLLRCVTPCQDVPKSVKMCQDLSRSVKTCQGLARSVKICPDASRSVKMRQGVSRCVKICQDASRCVKMCQGKG